jgi:hypothetical protein
VDDAAASKLTDPEFFKHIERQNQALLRLAENTAKNQP